MGWSDVVFHIPPGSLRNGVLFAISTFSQAYLTASGALSASATSNLKANWIGGRQWFQIIPWPTKIAGLLCFGLNMLSAVCRSTNTLGFTHPGPRREGVLAVNFVNAFLVPLVTLATISRMHRRLQRATLANSKILEARTGILEPRTVHGQSLKVHFDDASSKAQLLHYVQQSHLMTGPDGSMKVENLAGRIRDDFSPADTYAVGMVHSIQASPNWFTLMKALGTVERASLYRITGQTLVLIAQLICLVVAIYVPFQAESFAEQLSFNPSWFFFGIGSSIVGIWYEHFSLDLASPKAKTNPFALWTSWLLVQALLLMGPLHLVIYGFYGGHLLHVRIVSGATIFGTVHEFIVNEAWISHQQNEIEAFKVPSWIELEQYLREMGATEQGNLQLADDA